MKKTDSKSDPKLSQTLLKLDRRRATDPTSYAALILETRFSFMTS